MSLPLPIPADRTDTDAPGDPDALGEILALLDRLHGGGAGPADHDLIARARDLILRAGRIASAHAVPPATTDPGDGTDALTGLASRSGFLAALERQLSAAGRHGDTGLLALFDLDGFRTTSRWYGASAGDALLRHVAGLLRSQVRDTDTVARLETDRFAVLLARADPEGGRTRLGRIADALNRSTLCHDGLTVSVSASLGVASYRAGDTVADVLERATITLIAGRRRQLRQAH